MRVKPAAGAFRRPSESRYETVRDQEPDAVRSARTRSRHSAPARYRRRPRRHHRAGPRAPLHLVRPGPTPRGRLGDRGHRPCRRCRRPAPGSWDAPCSCNGCSPTGYVRRLKSGAAWGEYSGYTKCDLNDRVAAQVRAAFASAFPARCCSTRTPSPTSWPSRPRAAAGRWPPTAQLLGGSGHCGVVPGRVASGTAVGLPVLAARAVPGGVKQRALIAPELCAQPDLRQAPADQPAHRAPDRTAQPHLAIQAPDEPVGKDLRRIRRTGESDHPGQLGTGRSLHQAPDGRTLQASPDHRLTGARTARRSSDGRATLPCCCLP
ncbi:hypothetical protein SBADM41S_11262 [Streptomyces badius]